MGGNSEKDGKSETSRVDKFNDWLRKAKGGDADAQFDLGRDLTGSAGAVNLNHPHCARFCVLGGGSCSVGGN